MSAPVLLIPIRLLYIAVDYGSLHCTRSKVQKQSKIDQNHLDLDHILMSHDCALELMTTSCSLQQPCSLAARPSQSRYPSRKPYALFRQAGGRNTYTRPLTLPTLRDCGELCHGDAMNDVEG